MSKSLHEGAVVELPDHVWTHALALEPVVEREPQSRMLPGKQEGSAVQGAAYRDLRLSPEGDRVALTIDQQGRSHIWVLDLRRDTLSRLTFNPDNDFDPVWRSDGRRIAYTSWRPDVGATNLFWQRADGSGEPERLTTSANRQFQGSWHPSGRFFAFTEVRPGALYDVMLLKVEGDEKSGLRPGTPEPLVSTAFQEQDPAFSPDGRWLAYASNESGAFEVYVRPFPGPGGKWQISTGAGTTPCWSKMRPELLYQAGSQLMVVSYGVVEGSFRASRPRLWADLPPTTEDFDWEASGSRVALIHPDRDTRSAPPTRVLLFNFLDELRRLAPRSRGEGLPAVERPVAGPEPGTNRNRHEREAGRSADGAAADAGRGRWRSRTRAAPRAGPPARPWFPRPAA